MGRTRFKGPIKSENGFEIGSGPSGFTAEVNTTVIDRDGNVTATRMNVKGSVETLTGNKTITTSDSGVLSLDPGGSSRNVTLPAEADSKNYAFYIYNAADGTGENLVVKNDGGTTLLTMGPGMGLMFWCDGTDWIVQGWSGVYYDSAAGYCTLTSPVITDGDIEATIMKVGNGTHDATLDAANITDNHTLDIPDADGLIAVNTLVTQTGVEVIAY